MLGRDVHRHPEARATVDRLRATRDVLVVDLGWPSRDHAYADVATYGASRRVGRALLGLDRAGLSQPVATARAAQRRHASGLAPYTRLKAVLKVNGLV